MVHEGEVECYAQVSTLMDGEEQREVRISSFSLRNRRRAIIVGSIVVVCMVVGSLAIFKGTTRSSPAPQAQNVEELFDSEVSAEEAPATEFMTSRRLAQTIITNFDTKCANDQPICNPEVVFASDVQKFLNLMKKDAPELYNILAENKLSRAQQEIVMRVLPLAHNKKVLELGEIVAENVKHWEKSGSKVVHEKVKQAIDQYLRGHGSAGIPKMASSQPSIGNSSLWLSRLEPDLLAVVHKDGAARQLQLSGIPKRDYPDVIMFGVAMVIGAGVVMGIQIVLGIVYLVFEILNYMGKIDLPYMLKYVSMWIKGVMGSIECLTLAACPFVFLSYWLDAWLLYGHKPSDMKGRDGGPGIPWDFLLRLLPGLNHKDEPGWRLLAADARTAA